MSGARVDPKGYGRSSYPDLFVLRHGQTEWNALGRFQGTRDSTLTREGVLQALRQKELLQEFGDFRLQAYVSPQGRAMETARLALGPACSVVVDPRLREIGFGSWEGLTRDEVKAQVDGAFEQGLWNFQSPGGEDFVSIVERVTAFLDDLDDRSIIVTHGTTSMVLRGLWLGLDQVGMLQLPKHQGCVFHLANGQERVLR